MINPDHKSVRLVSEPAVGDMPSDDRDTGDTHHLHMSPSWDTWHTDTHTGLSVHHHLLSRPSNMPPRTWTQKHTHKHAHTQVHTPHTPLEIELSVTRPALDRKRRLHSLFFMRIPPLSETGAASAISLSRPSLTNPHWFLPTSCLPN